MNNQENNITRDRRNLLRYHLADISNRLFYNRGKYRDIDNYSHIVKELDALYSDGPTNINSKLHRYLLGLDPIDLYKVYNIAYNIANNRLLVDKKDNKEFRDKMRRFYDSDEEFNQILVLDKNSDSDLINYSVPIQNSRLTMKGITTDNSGIKDIYTLIGYTKDKESNLYLQSALDDINIYNGKDGRMTGILHSTGNIFRTTLGIFAIDPSEIAHSLTGGTIGSKPPIVNEEAKKLYDMGFISKEDYEKYISFFNQRNISELAGTIAGFGLIAWTMGRSKLGNEIIEQASKSAIKDGTRKQSKFFWEVFKGSVKEAYKVYTPTGFKETFTYGKGLFGKVDLFRGVVLTNLGSDIYNSISSGIRDDKGLGEISYNVALDLALSPFITASEVFTENMIRVPKIFKVGGFSEIKKPINKFLIVPLAETTTEEVTSFLDDVKQVAKTLSLNIDVPVSQLGYLMFGRENDGRKYTESTAFRSLMQIFFTSNIGGIGSRYIDNKIFSKYIDAYYGDLVDKELEAAKKQIEFNVDAKKDIVNELGNSLNLAASRLKDTQRMIEYNLKYPLNGSLFYDHNGILIDANKLTNGENLVNDINSFKLALAELQGVQEQYLNSENKSEENRKSYIEAYKNAILAANKILNTDYISNIDLIRGNVIVNDLNPKETKKTIKENKRKLMQVIDRFIDETSYDNINMSDLIAMLKIEEYVNKSIQHKTSIRRDSIDNIVKGINDTYGTKFNLNNYKNFKDYIISSMEKAGILVEDFELKQKSEKVEPKQVVTLGETELEEKDKVFEEAKLQQNVGNITKEEQNQNIEVDKNKQAEEIKIEGGKDVVEKIEKKDKKEEEILPPNKIEESSKKIEEKLNVDDQLTNNINENINQYNKVNIPSNEIGPDGLNNMLISGIPEQSSKEDPYQKFNEKIVKIETQEGVITGKATVYDKHIIVAEQEQNIDNEEESDVRPKITLVEKDKIINIEFVHNVGSELKITGFEVGGKKVAKYFHAVREIKEGEKLKLSELIDRTISKIKLNSIQKVLLNIGKNLFSNITVEFKYEDNDTAGAYYNGRITINTKFLSSYEVYKSVLLHEVTHSIFDLFLSYNKIKLDPKKVIDLTLESDIESIKDRFITDITSIRRAFLTILKDSLGIPLSDYQLQHLEEKDDSKEEVERANKEFIAGVFSKSYDITTKEGNVNLSYLLKHIPYIEQGLPFVSQRNSFWVKLKRAFYNFLNILTFNLIKKYSMEDFLIDTIRAYDFNRYFDRLGNDLTVVIEDVIESSNLILNKYSELTSIVTEMLRHKVDPAKYTLKGIANVQDEFNVLWNKFIKEEIDFDYQIDNTIYNHIISTYSTFDEYKEYKGALAYSILTELNNKEVLPIYSYETRQTKRYINDISNKINSKESYLTLEKVRENDTINSIIDTFNIEGFAFGNLINVLATDKVQYNGSFNVDRVVIYYDPDSATQNLIPNLVKQIEGFENYRTLYENDAYIFENENLSIEVKPANSDYYKEEIINGVRVNVKEDLLRKYEGLNLLFKNNVKEVSVRGNRLTKSYLDFKAIVPKINVVKDDKVLEVTPDGLEDGYYIYSKNKENIIIKVSGEDKTVIDKKGHYSISYITKRLLFGTKDRINEGILTYIGGLELGQKSKEEIKTTLRAVIKSNTGDQPIEALTEKIIDLEKVYDNIEITLSKFDNWDEYINRDRIIPTSIKEVIEFLSRQLGIKFDSETPGSEYDILREYVATKRNIDIKSVKEEDIKDEYFGYFADLVNRYVNLKELSREEMDFIAGIINQKKYVNPEIDSTEFLIKRIIHVWNSINSKKRYVHYNIQKISSSYVITKLDGNFFNTEKVLVSNVRQQILLEKFLDYLRPLLGDEISVEFINGFIDEKNKLRNLQFAAKENPDIYKNIESILYNNSVIFLGSFSDKNIIPVIRFNKEKLDINLYRQLYHKYKDIGIAPQLNDDSDKAIEQYIPLLTRAYLEEIKIRPIDVQQLIEGESILANYDITSLFKRHWMVKEYQNRLTYSDYRKYGFHTLLNIGNKISEQETDPIFYKDGEIYIRALIVDPTTLSSDFKDDKNRTGKSKYDGADFITGQLGSVFKAMVDLFNTSKSYKNIYVGKPEGFNDNLFFKRAVFELSDSDTVAKNMKKHNVAMLLNIENEKHKSKQAIEKMVSYEDMVNKEKDELNDKVVVIKLSDIHYELTKKEFKSVVKGFMQMFFTKYLSINNQLMKFSENDNTLEQYIKSTDDVMFNNLAKGMEEELTNFKKNRIITNIFNNAASGTFAKDSIIAKMLKPLIEYMVGLHKNSTSDNREAILSKINSITNSIYNLFNMNYLSDRANDVLKSVFFQYVKAEMSGSSLVIAPDFGFIKDSQKKQVVEGIISKLILENIDLDKYLDEDTKKLYKEIRKSYEEYKEAEAKISELEEELSYINESEIELVNKYREELRVRRKFLENNQADNNFKKVVKSLVDKYFQKDQEFVDYIDSLLKNYVDSKGRLKNNYAIIPRKFAKKHGLKPGDRVIVTITPMTTYYQSFVLEVVGIGDHFVVPSNYVQIMGRDYDIDTLNVAVKPKYVTKEEWKKYTDLHTKVLKNYVYNIALHTGKIGKNEKVDLDKWDYDTMANYIHDIESDGTKFCQDILGKADNVDIKSTKLVSHKSYDLQAKYYKEVGEVTTYQTIATILMALNVNGTLTIKDGNQDILVKINVTDKEYQFKIQHLLSIMINHRVDFPNTTDMLKYNNDTEDILKVLYNLIAGDRHYTNKQVKKIHSYIGMYIGDIINIMRETSDVGTDIQTILRSLYYIISLVANSEVNIKDALRKKLDKTSSYYRVTESEETESEMYEGDSDDFMGGLDNELIDFEQESITGSISEELFGDLGYSGSRSSRDKNADILEDKVELHYKNIQALGIKGSNLFSYPFIKLLTKNMLINDKETTIYQQLLELYREQSLIKDVTENNKVAYYLIGKALYDHTYLIKRNIEEFIGKAEPELINSILTYINNIFNLVSNLPGYITILKTHYSSRTETENISKLVEEIMKIKAPDDRNSNKIRKEVLESIKTKLITLNRNKDVEIIDKVINSLGNIESKYIANISDDMFVKIMRSLNIDYVNMLHIHSVLMSKYGSGNKIKIKTTGREGALDNVLTYVIFMSKFFGKRYPSFTLTKTLESKLDGTFGKKDVLYDNNYYDPEYYKNLLDYIKQFGRPVIYSRDSTDYFIEPAFYTIALILRRMAEKNMQVMNPRGPSSVYAIGKIDNTSITYYEIYKGGDIYRYVKDKNSNSEKRELIDFNTFVDEITDPDVLLNNYRLTDLENIIGKGLITCRDTRSGYDYATLSYDDIVNYMKEKQSKTDSNVSIEERYDMTANMVNLINLPLIFDLANTNVMNMNQRIEFFKQMLDRQRMDGNLSDNEIELILALSFFMTRSITKRTTDSNIKSDSESLRNYNAKLKQYNSYIANSPWTNNAVSYSLYDKILPRMLENIGKAFYLITYPSKTLYNVNIKFPPIPKVSKLSLKDIEKVSPINTEYKEGIKALGYLLDKSNRKAVKKEISRIISSDEEGNIAEKLLEKLKPLVVSDILLRRALEYSGGLDELSDYIDSFYKTKLSQDNIYEEKVVELFRSKGISIEVDKSFESLRGIINNSIKAGKSGSKKSLRQMKKIMFNIIDNMFDTVETARKQSANVIDFIKSLLTPEFILRDGIQYIDFSSEIYRPLLDFNDNKPISSFKASRIFNRLLYTYPMMFSSIRIGNIALEKYILENLTQSFNAFVRNVNLTKINNIIRELQTFAINNLEGRIVPYIEPTIVKDEDNREIISYRIHQNVYTNTISSTKVVESQVFDLVGTYSRHNMILEVLNNEGDYFTITLEPNTEYSNDPIYKVKYIKGNISNKGENIFNKLKKLSKINTEEDYILVSYSQMNTIISSIFNTDTNNRILPSEINGIPLTDDLIRYYSDLFKAVFEIDYLFNSFLPAKINLVLRYLENIKLRVKQGNPQVIKAINKYERVLELLKQGKYLIAVNNINRKIEPEDEDLFSDELDLTDTGFMDDDYYEEADKDKRLKESGFVPLYIPDSITFENTYKSYRYGYIWETINTFIEIQTSKSKKRLSYYQNKVLEYKAIKTATDKLLDIYNKIKSMDDEAAKNELLNEAQKIKEELTNEIEAIMDYEIQYIRSLQPDFRGDPTKSYNNPTNLIAVSSYGITYMSPFKFYPFITKDKKIYTTFVHSMLESMKKDLLYMNYLVAIENATDMGEANYIIRRIKDLYYVYTNNEAYLYDRVNAKQINKGDIIKKTIKENIVINDRFVDKYVDVIGKVKSVKIDGDIVEVEIETALGVDKKLELNANEYIYLTDKGVFKAVSSYWKKIKGNPIVNYASKLFNIPIWLAKASLSLGVISILGVFNIFMTLRNLLSGYAGVVPYVGLSTIEILSKAKRLDEKTMRAIEDSMNLNQLEEYKNLLYSVLFTDVGTLLRLNVSGMTTKVNLKLLLKLIFKSHDYKVSGEDLHKVIGTYIENDKSGLEDLKNILREGKAIDTVSDNILFTLSPVDAGQAFEFTVILKEAIADLVVDDMKKRKFEKSVLMLNRLIADIKYGTKSIEKLRSEWSKALRTMGLPLYPKTNRVEPFYQMLYDMIMKDTNMDPFFMFNKLENEDDQKTIIARIQDVLEIAESMLYYVNNIRQHLYREVINEIIGSKYQSKELDNIAKIFSKDGDTLTIDDVKQLQLSEDEFELMGLESIYDYVYSNMPRKSSVMKYKMFKNLLEAINKDNLLNYRSILYKVIEQRLKNGSFKKITNGGELSQLTDKKYIIPYNFILDDDKEVKIDLLDNLLGAMTLFRLPDPSGKNKYERLYRIDEINKSYDLYLAVDLVEKDGELIPANPEIILNDRLSTIAAKIPQMFSVLDYVITSNGEKVSKYDKYVYDNYFEKVYDIISDRLSEIASENDEELLKNIQNRDRLVLAYYIQYLYDTIMSKGKYSIDLTSNKVIKEEKKYETELARLTRTDALRILIEYLKLQFIKLTLSIYTKPEPFLRKKTGYIGYVMAKSLGISDEESLDYAINYTSFKQIDYSKPQRARIFRSELGSFLNVFMHFTQSKLSKAYLTMIQSKEYIDLALMRDWFKLFGSNYSIDSKAVLIPSGGKKVAYNPIKTYLSYLAYTVAFREIANPLISTIFPGMGVISIEPIIEILYFILDAMAVADADDETDEDLLTKKPNEIPSSRYYRLLRLQEAFKEIDEKGLLVILSNPDVKFALNSILFFLGYGFSAAQIAYNIPFYAYYKLSDEDTMTNQDIYNMKKHKADIIYNMNFRQLIQLRLHFTRLYIEMASKAREMGLYDTFNENMLLYELYRDIGEYYLTKDGRIISFREFRKRFLNNRLIMSSYNRYMKYLENTYGN